MKRSNPAGKFAGKPKSKSTDKPKGKSAGKPGKKPAVQRRAKSITDLKPREASQGPKRKVPVDDGKIRLNKYLSNAGICSRREADVLIGTGVVSVNGEIITELGYKINPADKVKYDGASIQADKLRYILLNKPKDYSSAIDLSPGKKTVMMLVNDACKETVFPIGKLDRQTMGLLLFTNDGELSKKLTSSSVDVEMLYNVALAEVVKTKHIHLMGKIIEKWVLESKVVSRWLSADCSNTSATQLSKWTALFSPDFQRKI
jgi:23S rRNA pseudouridine2605 synthase